MKWKSIYFKLNSTKQLFLPIRSCHCFCSNYKAFNSKLYKSLFVKTFGFISLLETFFMLTNFLLHLSCYIKKTHDQCRKTLLNIYNLHNILAYYLEEKLRISCMSSSYIKCDFFSVSCPSPLF